MRVARGQIGSLRLLRYPAALCGSFDGYVSTADAAPGFASASHCAVLGWVVALGPRLAPWRPVHWFQLLRVCRRVPGHRARQSLHCVGNRERGDGPPLLVTHGVITRFDVAPSSAAPPPPSSAAPAGCHPLTPSGHCYEPGEYCPTADAGQTGVAGDGKTIVCVLESGRHHWHPEG
jgi:hypothetical protein